MPARRSASNASASASASCGDAVMKWNVVPPSISMLGRAVFVSTYTGTWNGGLDPHQPRQSGSSP